jgi:hypothetical protein
MNDPTSSFTKLVPGFEFLQGLVKNAGAAIPGIGSWVAPTIDPAELEKRIGELRTVQFWLEQNARMLGATIQALEVQRMTLSTLKTMNVQMEDLRDSLKINVPVAAVDDDKASPPPKAAKSDATAAPGGADPMQWWGALTKQFTELAANAMKDGAAAAAQAAPGSAPIPNVFGTAPFAKSALKPAAAKKSRPAARKKPAGSARRT